MITQNTPERRKPRAGHWLSQSVAINRRKNQSVYWIGAVYWPSEQTREQTEDITRENNQQTGGGGEFQANTQKTPYSYAQTVTNEHQEGRGPSLSSLLSPRLSPLSSRDALGGFPYYNMACFLDVSNTKLLANVLAGSISRLLLPVDYYCQCILCQCPALKIEPRATIFLF